MSGLIASTSDWVSAKWLMPPSAIYNQGCVFNLFEIEASQFQLHKCDSVVAVGGRGWMLRFSAYAPVKICQLLGAVVKRRF